MRTDDKFGDAIAFQESTADAVDFSLPFKALLAASGCQEPLEISYKGAVKECLTIAALVETNRADFEPSFGFETEPGRRVSDIEIADIPELVSRLTSGDLSRSFLVELLVEEPGDSPGSFRNPALVQVAISGAQASVSVANLGEGADVLEPNLLLELEMLQSSSE